ALSARLIDHLLVHPKWNWSGRDVSDLWITGAAIADGFAVWEAWLGPHVVRSRTRTGDLPTMLAETLGAIFTLMDRHQDLWLEVRGSEPLPTIGTPQAPLIEPRPIEVEAMRDAFRLGVRDLGGIWDLILAPDTLGEVLVLEAAPGPVFRFPDDLWARIVYEFALGHHYAVVHREHLLRSLVPLYLGRTAAYVPATRPPPPTSSAPWSSKRSRRPSTAAVIRSSARSVPCSRSAPISSRRATTCSWRSCSTVVPTSARGARRRCASWTTTAGRARSRSRRTRAGSTRSRRSPTRSARGSPTSPHAWRPVRTWRASSRRAW